MKKSELNLDKVYRLMPQVIEISAPIFNDTKYIKFLNHAKIYDNGTYSNLSATKEWARNFYEKYNDKNETHTKRLKTGVNYWKRNASENINEIAQDAKDNFDMAARIEIVSRDKINKCWNLFSFYTDKKNEDRAYSFYGNHLSKLFKFISYFKIIAKDLIIDANKTENRIVIPNFKFSGLSLANACAKRDFPMEIEREKMEFAPSDKEWIVMLLYAHGLQKEVIARMLNKSLSTIVTQIESIKNKTNLMNRFEMMMYLKDRGEDENINFFVPYIPKNAA